MSTIKKIICPVDVYEFQLEVAEYAMTLANALEARITVLYVLEPLPPRCLPSVADEEEAKRKAEAKMAEVMTHFCRICQAEGEVVVGHAADKIIQIAEEHSGDMIIMASHCRTLVCRAIHGSVTNKVLANTKIPVLVIPPKEQ